MTPVTKLETIGVVGCGIMGLGIAELCLSRHMHVRITDVDLGRATRGVTLLEERLAHEVQRARLSKDERDEALGRLTQVTGHSDLGACDLVIEAIVEAIGPKRDLFTRLGAVCKPEAILASNTSSLSISELAVASGRPWAVVGLHFFNPPTLLKLVELVTTPSTAPSTVSAVAEFCAAIDREVVFVKDTPGFLSNRLLIPFIFDAIRLMESAVADAADIDRVCRSGFKHALGPLATADLIGLDTLAQIGDSLYEELGEARFKPPIALRRMVSLGFLGRKSGTGFFQYGRD